MVNGIETLPFGSEMGVHTATSKKKDENVSFQSIFQTAIQNAEQTSTQFDYDTQQLLTGEADNLAEVTINANKAQTALNLVVNLRDKAVDSYKEIMNMSL